MVLYGCKMLRNTYDTTHRIIHISGQTFGCNMLRIYRNQSLGATPESHHLSSEAGWICAAPKTQTCYVRSPAQKKTVFLMTPVLLIPNGYRLYYYSSD